MTLASRRVGPCVPPLDEAARLRDWASLLAAVPDAAWIVSLQTRRVLLANAEAAKGLVAALADHVAADAQAGACGCRHALQHALITAPELRDPAMVARLRCIAGRVLPG